MTTHALCLADLSDRALLAETQRLVDDERRATARLIAALAELDGRKLYLGVGCSSLFTYCTDVLHLSEHAAYSRIEVARAARRFPVILDRLADGSVTLTTVRLLTPHLTSENHRTLLDDARHKSRRDVEHLVAALRPRADVPSSIRKLPVPKPPEHAAPLEPSVAPPPPSPPIAAPAPSPAMRAVVMPLAPERYKIQFTVSRETHDKLRRAQNLLRHAIPNGDPAAIFDRALTLLVKELEKTKLAAASRPRPASASPGGSRHVPAAVKREVWARDTGQCAFVGTSGRCSERGGLEFHHVVPYADGGPTTSPNLQLRCRAHNAYEAEGWSGPLLAREEPGG